MDDPGIEPTIPILKKREEDRKGGGIVLPGSSVERGGGWAAALTGKAHWLALGLGLGGSGLVGYGIMRERWAATGENISILESLPSTPLRSRDSQGSRSLNYASRSGRGQIRWQDEQARSVALASPQQASVQEQPREPARREDPPPPRPQPRKDKRIPNNLPGAKLSSRSPFGKHDIFSGSRGFQTKNEVNLPASSLKPQKPEPTAQQKSPLDSSRMEASGVKSSRAMGQLKFTRAQSQKGAQSQAGEAGSSYGAQAFDQFSASGGQLTDPKGDGMGLGTIAQFQGSGAPSGEEGGMGSEGCPAGWSLALGGGCQPPEVAGENTTPYQGLVDQAKQAKEMAKNLMIVGASLVALAMLLLATGFAAGVAATIAGIGWALLISAQTMGLMGQQMGNKVGDGYGQKNQAKIMAGESSGVDMPPESSVHKDAQEESHATYRP